MSNSLHQYPYSYFTKEQSPIFRSTTLCFDQLNLLAPSKATYQRIGIAEAYQEILLQKNNLLNPSWLRNNRSKTWLTLSGLALSAISSIIERVLLLNDYFMFGMSRI